MKSPVATICIFGMIGIVVCILGMIGMVGGIATPAAAQYATTVTATVKVQLIQVSVTDGEIEYGTLGQNATSSTIAKSDTQTAENTGNGLEDFDIKGTTSTDWTLGETAASDVYVHKFCTSTCDTPPTNYTALTTDYTPIATNVDVNATTSLDLYINTPDPSTVYTQQNVNVIVQASAI